MTLLASLDDTVPAADVAVLDDCQTELLHQVLDTLSEREAGILTMRLDLFSDEGPATYREIGRTFGITPSRAKKTYEQVLTRFRVATDTTAPMTPLGTAISAYLAPHN